jgi:hypothetical protein
MSEELWNQLQERLSHEMQAARPCVSCWYQAHPAQPFPAQASSSLCQLHAQQTRTTWHHRRQAVHA